MADLTIREVAELTRCHIETARRLARMGELPGAYRVGHRWLVRREALAEIRGEKPAAEVKQS